MAASVPCVVDPVFGRITDPRRAYLVGYALGMREGYDVALRKIESSRLLETADAYKREPTT